MDAVKQKKIIFKNITKHKNSAQKPCHAEHIITRTLWNHNSFGEPSWLFESHRLLKKSSKKSLVCVQTICRMGADRGFSGEDRLSTSLEVSSIRRKRLISSYHPRWNRNNIIWERQNRGTSSRFFRPCFMWGAVDDRSFKANGGKCKRCLANGIKTSTAHGRT